MRAFISIELSEKVKEELVKIQEKIREENILKGKFIEKENLHLTLKFLGDISEREVNMVKEALEGIRLKKFKTKLDKIGFFSPSFVKVIWVGLSGQEIYKLHEEIDKSLKDLSPGDKRFESHVTLMRVKKIVDKERFIEFIEKTKPNDIEFDVLGFNFRKSELTENGPIYEDIEVYELE